MSKEKRHTIHYNIGFNDRTYDRWFTFSIHDNIENRLIEWKGKTDASDSTYNQYKLRWCGFVRAYRAIVKRRRFLRKKAKAQRWREKNSDL